VRGSEITVTPLGLSHDDMQFLEQLKWGKDEIFLIFGIPLGKYVENATQANANVAERTFINETLWPKLCRVGQKVTAEVLPRYGDDLVGQFEDIRWCIACNECIFRLLTTFSLVCTVNPELGREREMELKPAVKAKRVLVAGGGPAGMEAAHIAAKRGHQVTLYEAEEHLGGQFRIATLPPWKQEISPYLKYLSRRLEGTGVKVVLN